MKQHRYWTILIGLLIFLTTCTAIVPADLILPGTNGNTSGDAQVRATILNLPLSFIENQGQAPDDVKFHVAAAGHTISFAPRGVILRTSQEKEGSSINSEVEMSFEGAAGSPEINGIDQLPGKANFFIGNDASQWETDVPTFSAIRYEQLYPGIDLVYRGTEGVLKREFIVAPGAEPDKIVIGYTGIDSLALSDDGSLLISTPLGVLTDEEPVAYQIIDGKQIPVPVTYRLFDGSRVGFDIGEYNPEWPLVIDPTLLYSTYLGGNAYEYAYGIGIDGDKAVYVTGDTLSNNFPIVSPIYGYAGSNDIFVTKINPSGTALEYSTYIGTSQSDYAYGLDVDDDGNAYITGMSNNITVFPRIDPVPDLIAYGTGSTTNQGAYFLKLNPTGSTILFSSTWGASGSNTCGKGIAVDQMHNIYVGGYATAPDGIPMVSPIQGSINGNVDGFVLKITPDGSSVLNSTFFGGTLADYISGIAVDPSGNVYITGDTVSTVNFPLVNPIQPSFGGIKDAFVAKINSDWSSLAYSTYLGGTDSDLGYAIAVDPTGAAYVSGSAKANFPLVNPAQGTLSGTTDNFITKINPAGTALVYSTYWGSSGADGGFRGIAADASGNAYVTGSVASLNGPIVNPIQAWGGGSGGDNIVMKLDPTGTVIYATPLGGSALETGYAITIDDVGNAYVTGNTASTNFPLKNPVQGTFGGGRDAYVAVISPLSRPVANFTAAPPIGIAPHNVQFTDTSTNAPSTWEWSFGDSTPNSTIQNPSHTYTSAGTYTVTLTATNSAGSSGIAKTNYVNVVVPTVSLIPATSNIPLLASQDYEVVLNYAANGVAGYDLVVSIDGSGTGLITGVSYPSWAGLTQTPTLPADSVKLTGVDTGNQIVAGSVNVSLGNITIKGISTGITPITISDIHIDGHDANVFTPAITNGQATVIAQTNVPVAGFTANITSGNAPLNVQFTDTSSGNPTGWSWDFGNGVTSQVKNPVVTYAAPGTYNVKLIAVGPGGSNSMLKTGYITVNSDGPVAGFTMNPPSGVAPLTVQFNDTSTGPVTSWAWNFGNDSFTDSAAQNPKYIYTTPGTYTVTLTVTGSGGSASTTHTITVAAGTPVAKFVATPTTGIAPLGVQFSDASTGTVTSYSWTFGDGGTSSEQNPSHTYNAPGTYSVSLLVSGPGGSNTKTMTNLITVGGLAADFTANATSGVASRTVPFMVRFTDQSEGSPDTTTWNWIFGNGATSTQQNPLIGYTGRPQTFTVTLNVSNGIDNAAKTRTGYITITPYLEPFPGYTHVPTNPNGYYGPYVYEDVNGNGHLDYGDIVVFYQNMAWISGNTRVDVENFDYNFNGHIDYNDLIRLYWDILNART